MDGDLLLSCVGWEDGVNGVAEGVVAKVELWGVLAGESVIPVGVVGNGANWA